VNSDRIAVTTVSSGQRQILANMLEQYLLELGASPSYPYLDLYWGDRRRFAYFICVQEAFVGFALVRKTEEDVFEMAEFCISKAWRHRGLGRIACSSVFNMHPGLWQVGSYPGSASAVQFWSKAVPTNSYSTHDENRLVFSFTID